MTTIPQNHHVLAVHDLKASAAFYTDVLGFREVFDRDGWRFVKRDGYLVMLGECPDAVAARDLGAHRTLPTYWWTTPTRSGRSCRRTT